MKLQNDRLSSEIPQRVAQVCGFPREFLTLRLSQFVPKIAHLAISTKPRGPRGIGLLPRLYSGNGWFRCSV